MVNGEATYSSVPARIQVGHTGRCRGAFKEHKPALDACEQVLKGHIKTLKH